MSEVCHNCKYFKDHMTDVVDGYCTRYPKWEKIMFCYIHYCGEFKERDGE